MDTMRAITAAGTVLLAGALVSGCAPALPESLGLGGSDGSAEPSGTVGSIADDAFDDGENIMTTGIYLTLQGAPRGAKARFERLRANCVRNETSQTYDLPMDDEYVMQAVGLGYSTCGVETSWSDWRLTVTAPNGEFRQGTFEIVQTSTPDGFQHFKVLAQCWGDGTLKCASDERESDQADHEVHLRVKLAW